jgi:methylenetetrahydrofolate reductase (NADPH)
MNTNNFWQRDKPATISFEFFPARDPKAADKLELVIDKLKVLEPDFVSVTFGAGGTTRQGSYQLVKKLKNEKSLKVIPYMAGYGLGPDEITTVVQDYSDLNIDGLLCVRGDKPEGVLEAAPHPESFDHASELLIHVGEEFDLLLGAAGYPEGHKEAVSLEKDLEYLKFKVEKGAQFIITQYAYDNSYYYEFIDQCRKIGINIPIVIGIMPIYNVKMMHSLANLCGATITPQIKSGLSELDHDDKKAVSSFGIEFAVQQCRGLLNYGVDGLHFYTMDRAKSVTSIINQLREEGLA